MSKRSYPVWDYPSNTKQNLITPAKSPQERNRGVGIPQSPQSRAPTLQNTTPAQRGIVPERGQNARQNYKPPTRGRPASTGAQPWLRNSGAGKQTPGTTGTIRRTGTTGTARQTGTSKSTGTTGKPPYRSSYASAADLADMNEIMGVNSYTGEAQDVADDFLRQKGVSSTTEYQKKFFAEQEAKRRAQEERARQYRELYGSAEDEAEILGLRGGYTGKVNDMVQAEWARYNVDNAADYRAALEAKGTGADYLWRRAVGGAKGATQALANVPRGEIFDMTSALSDTDDTVQVLEHWFRQPVETSVDGETIPAGAVACSVQAGGHELRYIPNYWRRTGAQNTLFPFVHYWRIQDENRFWNKSELSAVLDLVDAADRKLASALLNDSFLSNDILLVEDGALADGEELTNEPGAIVHLKQGRMGGVQRLGGLQSVGKAAMDITWFKEQIERASRSYDTGTGKETARVTTASGLSMLRADGREQADIKRADRNAGFERLYELLDWLCLEFFDDDRMLYLGAPEGIRAPGQRMIYNSADFARTLPEIRSLTGEVVRPSREFFPRVDITVQAADGARRDRQTTLQALDSLTRANVTAENWRIFAAELEILDIPDRQEIVGEWERRFAPTGETVPSVVGYAAYVPREEGGAEGGEPV